MTFWTTFHRHFRKTAAGAVLALLVTALGSCYAPSPLYGTWADYSGDTVTFMSDMTYSSKVTVDEVLTQQTGSYDVLMNILVFTDDTGAVMETEWDIRGNILYLTWSTGSSNKLLTLYKIAN